MVAVLNNMKNKLLMTSVVMLMSACGLTNKKIDALGVAGAGKGASLTAIDIGLPDRAQIGPNAAAMLSAFHLQIDDMSCTGTPAAPKTVRGEVLDYTNAAKLDFSLKQGCDYRIILGLGRKGTAPNQLADSYYDNIAQPTQVTAAQLQGQSTLNLTLYLQLTAKGRAAGLPEGSQPTTNIATNQIQQFVPTQPNVNVPTVNLPSANIAATLDGRFRSMQLVDASGAPSTLADHFKGTYMFTDYSQLSCGPCISFSKQIENDAAVKSLLASGRCSMATFVSDRDIKGWVSTVGGNAGAHSFGFKGGPVSAGSVFGVTVRGTPTTAILDRSGKVLKEGNQELLSAFKKLCSGIN